MGDSTKMSTLYDDLLKLAEEARRTGADNPYIVEGSKTAVVPLG